MQSMFKDITKIIPHRPPMVMIDQYTRISKTAGKATKQFSGQDYGCDEGIVLQGILIECMAQTVAAHHGYSKLDYKNNVPATGMLVTIDSFDFFHPVPENESITITVDETDKIGPFHLIQGEILCGEKRMAQGRIKIFNSPHDHGRDQ